MDESISEIKVQLDDIREHFKQLSNLDDKISDLQSRIAQTSSRNAHHTEKGENISINNTVADDHSFDLFYKKFEDRFRGSETLIEERVAEHLPFFKKLSPKVRKKPVVDIGCGRGEFLKVLKDSNLHGIGIDMNKDMVDRAKALGFDAIQTDALSYLASLKSASIAVVTGFHIVEHIPFESLMHIFAECYRAVDRGGFVLFETPNSHSLNVGANTFYTDPSHIRPVPPELLSFMLEYVGFKPEIVYLHRLEPELKSDIPGLSTVHEAIFGYPDYAVVARKI
ncbi:MAG: class I SAM-dependent methyltransferase [Candidatus Saccharimonas sp.]|nr:class I SAM-dependent methyltransferase [Candidatus Saccharimonas sp.]